MKKHQKTKIMLDKLNKNLENWFSFKCNFCILNFHTRIERNEHVKRHFKQKSCGVCNETLVLIGDEWYELKLHVDENCNEITKTEYNDVSNVENIEPGHVNTTTAADCKLNDEEILKIEIAENTDFQLNHNISLYETLGGNNAEAESTVTYDENNYSDGSDYDDDDVDHDEDYDPNDNSNADVRDNDLKIPVEPATKNHKRKRVKSKRKEKPRTCEYCNKTLAHGSAYRKHILCIHNVRHEHPCDLCTKIFFKITELRAHLRVDHKDDRFACGMCEKTFKTRTYRDTHFQREHQEDQQLLTCDICSKNFKGREYLLHHMRIHRNRPKHECHICEKQFVKMVTLKNHIQIVHVGQVLFKCETCGKSFSSAQILRKHRSVHAEIRNFMCNVCGHGFNFKRNLDEHLRTHSENRSFVCSICGKGFKQVQVLRSHMLAHNKIKPYKCKEEGCNQAYANGTDLKRHRYNVHGDCSKLIKCPLCIETFLENKFLKKHLETHGPQEYYI